MPGLHRLSPISLAQSTDSRLQQLLDRALIAQGPQPGWGKYLKATGVVALVTLVGALLNLHVAPTNLAMLYLLGIVFISYRWGLGPALVSSLLSVLTLDFFFIPPIFSVTIADIWYSITAFTLMCIALVTSVMTAAVRRHALTASRREAQTATLYALTQALASAGPLPDVLQAAATSIKTAFGFEVAILLEGEAGQLVTHLEPPGSTLDASLRAAAERIFEAANNNRSQRDEAFLLLRTAEHVFGVIVLIPAYPPAAISSDDAVVLEAITGQIALAIKRATLEERARKAEREQQLAQQAKAEAVATLASGLAHDLNNLLTVVLGNASLAAETLPPDHPSKRLLGDLVTSGERAADIVAQVLAYSGKSRFLDESVDISAVVRGFLKSLLRRPPNIELSATLAEHLPLLKGDRKQLLQLIGNLYLNATEAIGEKPGRIVISTFHQYPAWNGESAGTDRGSTGEYVCMSVADTGCGIEESIRSRMFDPFFSTKFVGRGLGLSAAQGIMHAHNGVIQVSTEPGKGSTFTCSFPVSSP